MMSKLKNLEELFVGHHFDREVIALCVHRYLRYKLSLRDLVEMMAERRLLLAHTTIMRWVKRFTPEFVKRWNNFVMPTERSWRGSTLWCLASNACIARTEIGDDTDCNGGRS